MKAANNSVDVRNINNTSAGIVSYGGDNDFTNGWPKGTIALKQSYKDFDKILVVISNDHGNYNITYLWYTWHLAYAFSHGWCFGITNETGGCQWTVWTAVQAGTQTHPLSTETVWYAAAQNCGIIEIYGVTY